MSEQDRAQQETASTHIILMKDLENFVDVVESVHSGGASLFGLRSRKHSTNQHDDSSLSSFHAAGNCKP